MAGTVFPQREAARGLLSRLDPGAAALVSLLQLDDIYHAFWFAALGALMAVNLVFCIHKRRIWKRTRLFLIHGGLLALLAGALLSRLFGIEAYTEIPAGMTVERIFSGENGRPLDLGFQVRCDGFHFDRYESGMPKEYRSELTFLRDSQPVRKASLLVNHPVSFDGFTFYQSDFRTVLKAGLTVHGGGRTDRYEVVEGGGFDLPCGSGTLSVHVLAIVEDFMNLGPAVKLLVQSPEGCRNLYVLRDIGLFREIVPDLYERYPSLDPDSLAPWRIELAELDARPVTGLMVNRDPGAPVAAGGATVLMAGILLTWVAGSGRTRRTRGGRAGEESLPVEGKE